MSGSAEAAQAARTQPWLVRTSTNRLVGPLPFERLCEMIQGGEVGLQDEVCPANSYWFYLHERAEVARWLGIELPRPARSRRSSERGPGPEHQEEEITETTDVLVAPSALPEGPSGPGEETGPDSTRVLVRPSAAASSNVPAPGPAPTGSARAAVPGQAAHAARAAVIPSVDPAPAPSAGGSFFKNFGWLLIAGSALLVYLVVRLSRLQ